MPQAIDGVIEELLDEHDLTTLNEIKGKKWE